MSVLSVNQLYCCIRQPDGLQHSALLYPFCLIQKPEEVEVRLRSYSYSSPKAKPSRPQLNRDVTIGDLTEGE